MDAPRQRFLAYHRTGAPRDLAILWTTSGGKKEPRGVAAQVGDAQFVGRDLRKARPRKFREGNITKKNAGLNCDASSLAPTQRTPAHSVGRRPVASASLVPFLDPLRLGRGIHQFGPPVGHAGRVEP